MRNFTRICLIVLAALAYALPAAAQESDAWTAGDEDRWTILHFLERDDVSASVGSTGHDVQALGHGVLALSDAEAAHVAGLVHEAEAMDADTVAWVIIYWIVPLIIFLLILYLS